MTEKWLGLIAAAGSGSRLYPESKKKSKVLLTVDGQSLISRTVAIMADQIKLTSLLVIVGDNRNAVEKELTPERFPGLRIRLIDNPQPDKGLADGLLLAEPFVSGPFCLMLSDEYYEESDHHRLPEFFENDFSAVCCVKRGAHPGEISKNYAVDIEDGRLACLREKPETITNDILGCGTFLLKPDIFSAIRNVPPSVRTGRRELVDALDFLVRSGKTVLPFFIGGKYVNVNTADDLNYANYIARGRAFENKTVSLVIPAYNEEDSIGYVIDDFRAKVNEIIVADNGSQDRTADIARGKGARVFSAQLKGYGHAIRYGLSKATGDILVVTEADGSFAARDLGKLLEYLKDADMVIGTRTTKQMIEQGANMNLLLRLGNVTVAKIIELLWWRRNEPRLTDVGCTYRAIWKDAYLRVADDLSANGPSFSPEMIIEPIRHYLRIIEIPVSYRGRMGGTSKHSGELKAVLKTGFSMLFLILRKRIRYFVIDDLPAWIRVRKGKRRAGQP